jgi:hypothetical protein
MNGWDRLSLMAGCGAIIIQTLDDIAEPGHDLAFDLIGWIGISAFAYAFIRNAVLMFRDK